MLHAMHTCVLYFKGEASAASSLVLTCLPFHTCLVISPKEHLHFSSRSDSLKNSGIKCARIFHCQVAWAFIQGLCTILR